MFHQIMRNWIILKSTQKGLRENVQDGISGPLGNRAFKKTKVETDLLDTLYLLLLNNLQALCNTIKNSMIMK